MTASRTKSASRHQEPDQKNFTKRRTVEQGLRLADAAHAAVWRLYCEVFLFWRSCRFKPCRRHRRCVGEPAGCLMRGLPAVPPARRLAAVKEVMAGGPRRLPPATHLERIARGEPLPMLMTWRPGAGEAAAGARALPRPHGGDAVAGER